VGELTKKLKYTGTSKKNSTSYKMSNAAIKKKPKLILTRKA
jgi:hypothetical protein